ncbi:hypothetical protein AB0I81_57570 [Nonomuraea sp. NPDC050404]|uniref:hypothetical protein n=1 Tax=Nonomuraea sp. NPDC050404 TaxID=3155783 RepID=UPI0033F60707
MNEKLRGYIHHTVIDPPLRGVCPSFGVDLTAVGRHSALALSRRRVQDKGMLWIRLGLVGSPALLAFDPAIVGLSAAALLVAAWGLVFWRAWSDRKAAFQVITEARPASEQAPPLHPTVEDRLTALKKTNVIVFADGQGDPFIGSGKRLNQFHFNPIDITRASVDSNGRKATLKPFDAVDLHHYLATHVPSLGFDGLLVRNRLYVRGDFARQVSGLLPDAFGPPAPTVGKDWVKSGALNPSPYARTFICLERILSGGDLVVCMYVRAWLEQNLLSIERNIYFLPPVLDRYRPTDDFLVGGRIGIAVRSFAQACRFTLPIVFGAKTPLSTADTLRQPYGKEMKDARKKIQLGLNHDYGARVSLREAVAAYDTSEHYEDVDVIDSVKRLQRRLLDCIQEFLKDHGVDDSEFRAQLQVINQSISNIDTVTAGNVVIGGEGNIISGHGQVNSPAQGQGGAQQQGPPPGGPSSQH